MNQQMYWEDTHVKSFCEWLAKTLPVLKVDLDLPPSAKVPGGVKASCKGAEEVLAQYKWNAKWEFKSETHVSCDWTTTRESLRQLAKHLQDAIKEREDVVTFEVCKAILSWGGDRNSARGALPFLEGIPSISSYLASAQNMLSLETVDLSCCHIVQKMNSMLTKMHALAAVDGIPIYDSRVAIAAAALVELFRRQMKGDPWRMIPASLTFPAVDPVREIGACFKDALTHGTVASRSDDDSVRWTQAKIRLGWILQKILADNQQMFVNEKNNDWSSRMHALEAALFMIGYNVRSLAKNGKSINVIPPKKPKKPKIGAGAQHSAQSQYDKFAWKTAKTLVRGNEFRYRTLDDDQCIYLEIAQNYILMITSKFIDAVMGQFEESGWVDSGFNRGVDGKGLMQDESFGAFLERESAAELGVQLTRQHATRFAAVFVELRYCVWRNGKPVQLNFGSTPRVRLVVASE
jgi:hypothetical protein